MSKVVRRGYVPGDEKEFGTEAMEKINAAANDIYYLLNHGYSMKSASVFTGNHYMLSERQRLALARMVSQEKQLDIRTAKCRTVSEKGGIVFIDGFNTIITLEIALSGTTLLKCMDGTVRDLAGLRGTYSLIDKTSEAIQLIGEELENMEVSKAVFYMDAPVSNTGRLAACIHGELASYPFEVETEVINNVDSVLSGLSNVVTGDAIILDKCISWINFTRSIIDKKFPGYHYVELDIL
ncbi:MAG: DUF434 domain-containing protein [Lachnospiraceae bacterium]|nr:DUF434 domain-containing protein [Lachnospiraceae bacterium]